MTLCDTEEKNVYFNTSTRMKACSLHVVYGFTERREGVGVGRQVGRMAGVMLWITIAEQRSSPTGLGLRLCLWGSLSLHDSNSFLSLTSSNEIHGSGLNLYEEGLFRRTEILWWPIWHTGLNVGKTDVNTKLVIMIILLLLLTGRPYLLGRVDDEEFLRKIF